MQFVRHSERCFQLSRNRRWNATQYCRHITVAMEIQQCVPFALLRYLSLSTMSVWRFYDACSNKTYLFFVQIARYFCPVLTKFGSSRFSLSSPIPNFTKIQPVGAGQTERTTLTGAVRDHMRPCLETETPNLMLMMLRHEIV
jgi:hypothetical protein